MGINQHLGVVDTIHRLPSPRTWHRPYVPPIRLHVHVYVDRALGICIVANPAVERTTMYIGLGTLLVIIILILVLT